MWGQSPGQRLLDLLSVPGVVAANEGLDSLKLQFQEQVNQTPGQDTSRSHKESHHLIKDAGRRVGRGVRMGKGLLSMSAGVLSDHRWVLMWEGGSEVSWSGCGDRSPGPSCRDRAGWGRGASFCAFQPHRPGGSKNYTLSCLLKVERTERTDLEIKT